MHWFLSRASPEIDEVWHDCSVANSRSVGVTQVSYRPLLLPLPGPAAYLRYVWWCVRATSVSIWNLLWGRWWYAMVLRDAAVAVAFRLQPRHHRANEYLLHNSSWFWRPLWTYEAESIGAKVTFYFYSTNNEGISKDGRTRPIGFGWRASTWPRYLVWDEWQARWVRRAVGARPEVDVVGAIPFVGHDIAFTPPNGPSLAVFDVAPFRPSTFLKLGLDSDLYSGESALSFITDLQVVTARLGVHMLWKRKRHFGSHISARYRRVVDGLVKNDLVVGLDPEMSVARVIESAMAAVSFPFTSTALVARQLGTPSCYYDPTGTVYQQDPGAHGIEVVRGPEELERWLRSVMSNAGGSFVISRPT